MNRTLAYLRVSTEHQTKGDSNGLASQRQKIDSFVEKNNLSSEILYFVDEGVSGGLSLSSRGGLGRLFAELRAGDTVIVGSLCRLSRSLLDGLLLEQEIKRKKCRLVSVKGEGTENESPESILMRRMLQTFSDYEKSLIQTRTIAALQSRKNRGLRTGTIPYGFTTNGTDKTLVLNNREIKFLLQLEKLRDSGFTYQKCCDELNAMSLFNRKGNDWNTGTLQKVYKKWISEGRERYLRLSKQAA